MRKNAISLLLIGCTASAIQIKIASNATGMTTSESRPSTVDKTVLKEWWYGGRWPLPSDLQSTLPAWVDAHPEDADASFYLAALAGQTVPGFTSLSSDRVFDLLRRAAGGGHAPAIARLGMLTAGDPGGLKMLEQVASTGSPDGLMNLGLVRLYGLGGGKSDLAAAEPLLKQALDRGQVRAHSALAALYRQAGNPALCMKYLLSGAAKGDANSMIQLALCYRSGDGVPRSAVKAFRWASAAAERGVPDACALTADLCRAGDGTAPDAAAALRWLQRGVEARSNASKHMLATMFLTGEGIPAADPNAAIELLTGLARSGDAAGQLRLGQAYLEGEWVGRDVGRARALFEEAAKGGEAQAGAFVRWIDAAVIH
ncbi:MAG: Sel1 repeat family [Phycisphaerales bacterium]|nr:Sel1 repeat family [Phycisphaerales bacterium]